MPADSTEEDKYLVTQLALWDVLKKTMTGSTYARFNMDNLEVIKGYEAKMANVLQASRNLSSWAMNHPMNYGNPVLRIDTSAKQSTESGDSIVSGPYRVVLDGFAQGFAPNAVKVSLTSAPTTAKIMNANWEYKNEFSVDEDIYIKADKGQLNANFTLNINVDGAIYSAVLYGDSTASTQGYAAILTEPVSLSESVPVSWSTDTGNITLIKLDQNNTKIPNVRFELRDSSNTKVADGVTNSQGRIEFINVPTGKYSLVEASSPGSDYIVEEDPKYVTVTAGGSETVYFENFKLQAYLKIKKVDEDGNPIKNVEFKVYNSSGKVFDEIVTGSDGIAESKYLPVGTYTYKETDAPSNVKIDSEPVKFTVNKNDEVKYFELENEIIKPVNKKPKPSKPVVKTGILKIMKLDEFGKQLSGVKFQILDKDKKVIETITTDSSGYAVSDDLELGTYYYKEISAPSDQIIVNDEEHEFKVEDDGDVVSVTVYNKLKKGYLQVIKKDQYSHPIAGVSFEVYNNSNELLETITTNENGVANSKVLVKGDYYFKEISAPSNVIMNTETQKFTIVNDGDVITKELTNDLIEGQIKVIKKDEAGKPIEGVTFKITDEEGKTEYDKITTDAKGIAISKKLDIGTYHLIEESAPNEFIVSTEVETFNITNDTTFIEKELVNKRKTAKFVLLKLDKDNNTPIVEAKFEILDSNKKVIDTLVTDNEGKAESKQLELGTYYYKEVSAPSEYSFDNTEYEFKIEDNDVNVETTVYNIHKKLPVTGGFFSTDIIIIIIVTISCIVLYILIKMAISYIQNR